MGLVGCGTIGRALAKALTQGPLSRQAHLVAVCDTQDEKARALVRRLRPRPQVLSMEGVVRRSQLVLEAASARAVPKLLKMVTSYRKNLMVMSTAGLLESPGQLRQAQRRGCRIKIPSGALIGIDGLKALSTTSIQKVTLTTRKPPKGFSLKNLKRPQLLFNGPALKAVRAYPQNVNVAATVLLSGVPSSRFRVRVVADPDISRNIHELSAEGKDGRIFCRTENLPSENPKTSRLAILSALAALRQLFNTVHIGT